MDQTVDLAAKVEELIKLTNSLKQEISVLKGNDVNVKVDELEKEMADLKNEINELKYGLMKQNAKILAIIHELSESKKIQVMGNLAILRDTTKTKSCEEAIHKKVVNFSKMFPLGTLDDLDKLEKLLSIGKNNEDEVVLILQRLLLPKGVAKNLKFVLSDNIIVQSNLEGIHGKKRLLNYQRFIDAVYQAVYKNGYSINTFLSDFRRGLRCVKNRNSKIRCRRVKKRSSKYDEDSNNADDDYGDEDVDEFMDDEEQSNSQLESIIKTEDNSVFGD
ncbi:uncharacterized protein LOC131803823 [Musca domestica]|uniref:Uncharacterized protein LOC131803823 n=1 Tax=Musca domestica TaxID=7370 RepID=A0A1I8NFR0_MUSDO|nr:uncharacterized protein LOC131803823 [Musca domestica]